MNSGALSAAQSALLDRLAKQTEQYLQSVVTPDKGLQATVYEAMAYSLFAGGKRIRPVLTLSCCTLCGGETEAALPFAAGLEMIHTYSLIHDDLPCMDDDDLRRGRPTCHKVFGEAMAVLAGDALLTEAFAMMAERSRLSPERTLAVIGLIGRAAGPAGMIGGQVIDIESEGTRPDEGRLTAMHRLKTGALIEAACLAGAHAAGASEIGLESLSHYAKHLGLAFQIKDDILDVESTEEVLGKPIGSDQAEQKVTFVTLYGLDRAKELLQLHTAQAMEALAPFGDRAAFLVSLAPILCSREK